MTGCLFDGIMWRHFYSIFYKTVRKKTKLNCLNLYLNLNFEDNLWLLQWLNVSFFGSDHMTKIFIRWLLIAKEENNYMLLHMAQSIFIFSYLRILIYFCNNYNYSEMTFFFYQESSSGLVTSIYFISKYSLSRAISYIRRGDVK